MYLQSNDGGMAGNYPGGELGGLDVAVLIRQVLSSEILGNLHVPRFANAREIIDISN